MSFEKEFLIFSGNISQAARAFYYHVLVDEQVKQERYLLKGVQNTPQFWQDYRLSNLLCAVIILGRIFDKNGRTHSLKSLIKNAEKSEDFSLESLRERKGEGLKEISVSVDEYLSDVHILDQEDWAQINDFAQSIRVVWNSHFKDIRNKIFAHEEKLNGEQKSEYFKKAQYAKLEEIIEKLLTLENVLFHSYHNGARPGFSWENNLQKSLVNAEVKKVLKKLV
tara:strand:- start:168 stop:836 length:669 start_codon:yes stop_codon:yes gene_type:complete